ncbi:MAG: hypothetical protein DBX94_05845 [Coriobacteriia bacterium]|nr:MAG: hypothetical protein DBX94_05845 [Coriobacteriia bacterium]
MKLLTFNEPVCDLDEGITLQSTSRNTAIAQDVVLRDGKLTRMTFKPGVVNNLKDPSNSVHGKIVYERRGKEDEPFPSECAQEFIGKKSIHKGDALELALNTGETRNLYDALAKLYGVAEGMDGVPFGASTYVKVDNAARTLLRLLQPDPSAAHMIADRETFDLVRELLKLLTQGTSRDKLKDVLSELEDGSLQSFSTALNLERLQRVATDFEQNLGNGTENDWQRFFKENDWIIPQVMSVPCALYGEQAYVGGKTIDNHNGNVLDFLYQNRLTKNVILVEIKTPVTKLLGGKYRARSYSMSDELSGGIAQVLSYRQTLLNEFNQFCAETRGGFEAFSPQCVVIIGSTGELDDPIKVGSFENFRSCLSGVTVLTYDELLGKVRDLIGILAADEG